MIDENIKVKAFNFETNEVVGVFESISQAQRKLYIRNRSTIWVYLFGNKFVKWERERKGVTSYKTGIKYRFEKA